MSMDMLASLLRELLKDVRALQAGAKGEGLPGAVTPEAAARLLGCSVETLQSEIERGRIQTVPVGDREHVPLSEISRMLALRRDETARENAPPKPGRRPKKPKTRGSTTKRRRRSKSS